MIRVKYFDALALRTSQREREEALQELELKINSFIEIMNIRPRRIVHRTTPIIPLNGNIRILYSAQIEYND